MVASRYYLDYRTMKLFQSCFGGEGGESATLEHLCRMLSDAQVSWVEPAVRSSTNANGTIAMKGPCTGSEDNKSERLIQSFV